MVCHTYYCKKNQSCLPCHQSCLFMLILFSDCTMYYISLQFALLFVFVKIKKYVTQCSPSLKENYMDKTLVNTLQLFEGWNLYKTPLAVKMSRKLSFIHILKDSPFIKGCSLLSQICERGQGQIMRIVTQSLFPGFEQIFGSKIPDFFQNNKFFFQTHTYQIGEQQRP